MKKRPIASGLTAALVLLAAAVLLVGCNTIKGMGKDLQKAGEELEESADKND